MDVVSGSAVLATEEHGSGEPTVLLLHAGVNDQRSWRHVVEALPDVRCLSFDARGFGRTTYQPENGWSNVDDATAVLDAYGVDSAVVVGASVGGRTALDLALTHPDRVRALVLIGPAISGAPEPAYEPEVEVLGARQEAAFERGDRDEVNRIDAHLWLDGPLAEPGRVGGETRELFLEMNAIAEAADDPGEEGSDVNAWDRLGEIAMPTLLLLGSLDLRYIAEGCRHAADLIPNASLVELPGVAHLPHLENDQATVRAIADFVSSI